jgi:undecaprenyl-diphosphatase
MGVGRLAATPPATYTQEWGPEVAIIFGIVEGLTEFLPVSSTGHLILAGHLLGFTGALAESVEVSIQLGSILAVVAYERRKIAHLLSHAVQEQVELISLLQASHARHADKVDVFIRSGEAHPNLWFLIGLVIAFLPAAVLGFLTHDWIEAHLFHPGTVAMALIIGGLIILWVEAIPRYGRVRQLEEVKIWTAVLVGLAQCAALFPGISRSGATIVGGLLVGMDRRVATEYSFFLALPTMIVATVYKMLKSYTVMTQSDVLALMLGLIVSFAVAWIVIAAFLAFVKNHSLRAFAYYRILLGLIVFSMFS